MISNAVLGNRKKNSSNSSSSVIPLASPTENSRGVGGSNSQGSDTSSEVTVSQRSNNNTTSTPTQNTLVVTKKSSSTAAPVSVTGTPSGSGGIAHKDRQRLVFNGQPYTAMSRQASVTYADETGISDGQQLQHFQHSSLGHQTDHEAGSFVRFHMVIVRTYKIEIQTIMHKCMNSVEATVSLGLEHLKFMTG